MTKYCEQTQTMWRQAVEGHGGGVAVLTLLANDVEPHRELLRVLDLVRGG
jgi:hypothetical protein